jgi:L-arabinokinase
MAAVAYYITGHGYGHAVRSLAVIRRLKEIYPDLTFHLRTTAPAWLFTELPFAISRFDRALDVGIVQQNSLDMNIEATLQACASLHQSIPDLIDQELSFIKEARAHVVVGDVPPLCFEIAARAGLPSVAIANFSWNWIYRHYLDAYPAFFPLIEQMEEFYAKTALCLALPFAGDLGVFPKRTAIPLITRTSRLAKHEARKKYGLPKNATIVLVSFGGLGLRPLVPERLQRAPDYFFVATGSEPLRARNLVVLSATQHHYEDLVRAADAVVTKAGYGVVADVVSHRVPILYTERGPFPEYDFLVQMLNAWATSEFIPQDKLLTGDIAPYLNLLMRKKPHWPEVALSGAEAAANKVLELLG